MFLFVYGPGVSEAWKYHNSLKGGGFGMWVPLCGSWELLQKVCVCNVYGLCPSSWHRTSEIAIYWVMGLSFVFLKQTRVPCWKQKVPQNETKLSPALVLDFMAFGTVRNGFFFITLCASYFSCLFVYCCDQIPNKKQFKREFMLVYSLRIQSAMVGFNCQIHKA